MKIAPHIAPLAGLRLKTNLNNMSTSHIKFIKELNLKRGTFIISKRMQGKDKLYNIATGKTVTTENGIFYEVYPELYTMKECRLLESALRYFI